MERNTEIFREALAFSLEKMGRKGTQLKTQQLEAIKNIILDNQDTVCILPTGYGKSLIYQLLPYAYDHYLSKTQVKYEDQTENISPSTILVISPLNALMLDQVNKLQEYVKVCILKMAPDENEHPIDIVEKILQPSQIIFAHPEALIENKRVFHKLSTFVFKDRIKAVVIDEAHLVEEWKSFRPCYGKLGILSSIFSSIPFLALTATATCSTKAEIVNSVGLINPAFVEVNPDRPNIFLASYPRPKHGDDKLEPILYPIVAELEEKRQDFPLTLVYGSLETISECFRYASAKLGLLQFHPVGAPSCSKNRLFTQFHAQYPDYERERIVKELVQGTSKLRLLFVTVAFGIGVDVQNIRRVIHIGVPYTLEEYLQEAGRCGRDGLPAVATIYYNSYDLSKSRKGMTSQMREYVQTNQCKREFILSYFGYKCPPRTDEDHFCCDYHKRIFSCEECVLKSVAQLLSTSMSESSVISDVISALPATGDHEKSASRIDNETANNLREELATYRLSLHGCGKSCAGSVSLTSGFSMETIDLVLEYAHQLTSVEDTFMKLPLFNKEHAVHIFRILKKHLDLGT